ncbi:dipeptidyl peptidase [Trichophyton mentagrophytes]|uniref:dipeptidyl-peptidase IV n=1 Tax=Trichophyton interdigitale TaxID=101480 RepID=A0A9P5CZN2_9EURO|nr:Extracellular dipeptidyl-peptidase Dpp4 [Trichophyton interdigitale]KAG8205656.1 Extracellular dipeptidyl-peptidase Dpp4 [Trichophyton interdigitale]GBF63838.1 dipeptidyl peptidase [Trichophyton mentagrophytes]
MKFLSLLLLAGIAQAIVPPREPRPPTGGGNKLLTYKECVPRATISPRSTSLAWINSDEDGQYISQSDDGALILQNIVTNTNKTLVAADKVPKGYYDYWFKPDLSAVLWATNYTKQYRHSYFANYFILDIEKGSLTPLAQDQAGDIQYAQWSPVDNSIAYVRGNDLYIWNNGTTKRITENGGPDIFNGVPDWVYEEEIFGDRFALWFSPDGEYLAYLRFNETGVPTYTIPYYKNKQKIAPAYPRELEIRYPKVSAKNPTVQFHLLNIASSQESTIPVTAFPENDLVIGEVAWLSSGHDSVAYRAFNRVQDREKIVSIKVESKESKVIRERDGTDGWIDNLLSMSYIGDVNGKEYYVDISDASGWAHIYLYPVDGGKEIALTKGEWEVVAILKVDTKKKLIYFTSTKYHSTTRHVYSVSYDTKVMTPLVNDKEAAYYTASFSAKGGYYILSYQGPNVPYQELYSTKDSKKPLKTITSNDALLEKLKEYKLPKVSFFEIKLPSGETLNVKQRLPPNFNPHKKYPVLFTPYGGPGAQEVSQAWNSLDFKSYITSDPELEYVTWTVDNRGTGYKGRKFRSAVAKRLGFLEAQDQVFAAKELLKNRWADKDHIGIWGWSYGGFLTAKTLETDSGVFTFGISTAPVSDFRLYDSMYTERYMKTVELNADGYSETAVHKVDGFKNLKGHYLIQHGTGDDNVHFQNAAVLSNTLMNGGVTADKLTTQWFTDSDHGIRYDMDSTYQYKQLAKMVYDQKQRRPERPPMHQWSKRVLAALFGERAEE